MDNRVVILNGPPGCGKDTLAKIISERLDWYHGEFKSRLYELTAEYYDVDLYHFKESATHRKLKELVYTMGLTPREMLKNVSEKIYKPRYGAGYFGTIAADYWDDIGKSIIVSDGGFEEELVEVQNIFCKSNVIVIRLYREGFDFQYDSRDYLMESTCDIHLLEGEIDKAVDEILYVIGEHRYVLEGVV